MTWKQTVAVAVIIGCVAAGIVWFLERFEVERLHGEVGSYLEKMDRFRAWEAEHGGGQTE